MKSFDISIICVKNTTLRNNNNPHISMKSSGRGTASNASSSRRYMDAHILRVDDGRNALQDGVDVHSDCDSEGNEPPRFGTFVAPSTMDGVVAPPPRTNAEIKLPFSNVRNRLRYRDQFASKIFYEEWVEGEGADVNAVGPSGSAKAVKKLESDSDYPVGKSFFWHAVCPPCNQSFFPHVPSAWTCPTCKGKTWQLPDDPESKACAICKRKLARLRIVGGKRLRSPISLNGHNCKRCGRVVCDDCYNPNAVALPIYGYSGPQKVCTDCKHDIEQEVTPPEEEDTGTMHEEYTVKEMAEEQLVKPYWPPNCSSCKTYLGEPPLRWECRTCGSKVWQPTDHPLSAECWLCNAKFPKVRCHRCGQLVCDACGAFKQPLPELGFDTGFGLSVCRGCYSGISYADGVIPDDILAQLKQDRASHKRGAPERAAAAVPKCCLCTSPCAAGVNQNCFICGWLNCMTCTQYEEPTGRGGPVKAICTLCFDPRRALLPDHRTMSYWPPRCGTCCREWLKPPERWRCPFGCGNVWQPLPHVASLACASCGKPTKGNPINCRCCGRVVCNACGSTLAEVPELGFTRGSKVPRCPQCKPGTGDQQDSSPGSQEPSASVNATSAPTPAPAPVPAPASSPKGPAQATPKSGQTSPARQATPTRGRGRGAGPAGRGGGSSPPRGKQ